MTAPLPSRLAAVRDELNGTTSRLHRLVDTLDETTWGRSPAAGKWSIARCIEHLNMTSIAYLPILRAAFKDARAAGKIAKNPNYELVSWGWLLFKLNDPPIRFTMKTPDAFVPPTIEPKAKVVAEYDSLQRELVSLLEENGDLDFGKIKVGSPFNANIKYSAYAAYRIIPAHQRRHLLQAEHVFTALAIQPR
jgi:hypothetical protein